MSKNESNLGGFPIYIHANAKGTVEVLASREIYKWTADNEQDGRWQAVLLIKSTYPDWKNPGEMAEGMSARIFSWRWQEKSNYKGREDSGKPIYEGTGEYYWRQLSVVPVNKQSYLTKIVNALEEFKKELVNG